jgi:hypothetical protein
MLGSITHIESPLKILLNLMLICYCCSQVFELCRIFKTSVSHLYVIILPGILVTRQQHVLSFLSAFTSRPTLLASVKVSVFFFMVSVLSQNC